MSFTTQEVDRIRELCERDGISKTASVLSVHRTSVMAILAGEAVRPNTEKVIRMGLSLNGDSNGSNGASKAVK